MLRLLTWDPRSGTEPPMLRVCILVPSSMTLYLQLEQTGWLRSGPLKLLAAMVSMFVPSQNSHVKLLTSKSDGFGRWGLQEALTS